MPVKDIFYGIVQASVNAYCKDDASEEDKKRCIANVSRAYGLLATVPGQVETLTQGVFAMAHHNKLLANAMKHLKGNAKIIDSSVHGKGLTVTVPVKKGDCVALFPCDAIQHMDGNVQCWAPVDVDDVDRVESVYDVYRLDNTVDFGDLKVKSYSGLVGNSAPAPSSAIYKAHYVNDMAMLPDLFDNWKDRTKVPVQAQVYPWARAYLEQDKSNNCEICTRYGVSVLIARRDIAPGEELGCAYGLSYWMHVKGNLANSGDVLKDMWVAAASTHMWRMFD